MAYQCFNLEAFTVDEASSQYEIISREMNIWLRLSERHPSREAADVAAPYLPANDGVKYLKELSLLIQIKHTINKRFFDTLIKYIEWKVVTEALVITEPTHKEVGLGQIYFTVSKNSSAYAYQLICASVFPCTICHR